MQIADSAAQAAEVIHVFEKTGFSLQAKLFTTPASLDGALNGQPNQLVIVHISNSSKDVPATLEALQRHAHKVPCIIVSDTIDQFAIDCMKAGARDCIVRGDTVRLQEAARNIFQPVDNHGETLQALRESEEKFSRVFHISPDPITITRLADGVYLDVNAGFTQILGYAREEVVGKRSAAGKQGIWVNLADRDRLIEGLKSKGEVVGLEAPFRTKNGSVVVDLLSARVVKLGGVDCILAFTRDITERRRADRAIKESEARYRGLFDHMVEGFAYCRMIYDDGITDFVYLAVNPAFSELTGLRDVIGKRVSEVIPGIQQRDPGLFEIYGRVARTGSHEKFEIYVEALGDWYAVSVYGTGNSCFVAMFSVITDRKRAEQQRDATIRLLRLCNRAPDLKGLSREITLFFKQLANCEAVGLRLRDGPDFPYFETHGFSNEFVQAEKFLCTYQCGGEPACDDAGNPLLACMCGNVLQGRIDPTKPFFTQYGSFWTNSTTELIATTTEKERQTKARGRCTGEGYESIALVPLRSGRGTLGLLQLNDRQKGRFNPDLIKLIESLAGYLTVALEKLQSDQALRSSEEHLRQVLATAEAGYCFIDNEGIYRRVNEAFVRMHGYSHADELLGQHFSVTQVESEKPAAEQFARKLLAGGTIAGAEFSRRQKDGSTAFHSFSAHAVREHNRVVGLEAFLIDTTRLHTVNQQYQMLFEQMLDGFVLHEMIYDPEGEPVDYRFLAMNPAFEQMTGMKASLCKGHTAREVLPGLESKWLKTYHDVVKTGEARRFEDFSRELNKHFEIVAFSPAHDQFACLVRDISNRKQLELQLVHSQKMEAVGQLAGGVAHDFNNFLAAIMMHLSLLQRTPGTGGEVRESLKELEAEARRAAGLTRQLLMFSRRQVMQLNPTDLNDLLTHLLKMLRRLIGEHIRLIFSSEAAPLWAEADPGMIEQVIMNLCVNARDAMPRGGDLRIEAASLHLGATEHLGDTENRAGNFICLTVADNGVGMSQDTLARIFEPFFTTKEPGKGTGLGLATVYSIVKQHKGWINVSSVLGQGSAFRIFLPAIAAPSAHSHSATQSPIQGGSEGILVVEDDAGFRNLVGMSLKVLGYRVFEAVNAREARAIWEAHQADIGLLFADVVLPGGMNGLELGQQLRTAKPTLRMIVTTGYLGDSIKPEQLEAESIVFLPKPFTAEALANAVRECLDHPPIAPDAS
ncbi:MAG: PAS domain S-box protein [Nibricoccus sp.]